MAVLRQANLLGNQRVDIPHLRALESAVAGDFDLLAGIMFAGKTPLIISGFYVLSTGVTVATNLKIQVKDGSLIHYLASESGSIFAVPSDRADEQLNSTNPRITGSFTPNMVNYIGIDLIRSADDTTVDLVEFIDSDSELETPVQVPLGRTLDYRIVITTLDFDNNPGVCPIAKVTLDANGNITNLVDARQFSFRLGSGGTAPNIKNSYSWPAGRFENTSGDVFVGGDKAISSFKSWMDAVMSRLWEVGGGEYWYSPTNNSNERLVRTGTPFTSNGEFMEWDGTNLHWKGLVWVFANSTSEHSIVADQTTSSPGLTDLADGECIYVDVNRATNGTTVNAVKGTLTDLGTPVVAGSRLVLAWRYGSSVYTRDQSYAIGSSFKLATESTSGTIKLSATVASLDNGGDPRVAAVDNEGLAYATGVSRGGGTIGSGVLFGGLGAGTLNIGGSGNDTNVRVASFGTTTVRADGGNVDILSENGPMTIGTGGTGGDLDITVTLGNYSLDAGNGKITESYGARVENASSNNYSLDATGNLAFTNNVNFVFTSGGNIDLHYIQVTPWGKGSFIYLRLGAGIIVHNAGLSPPPGYATILLSTSSTTLGPTTDGTSLLVLMYDGTSWVQPGVF